MMTSENWTFISSILIEVPELLAYCGRIEKIEFSDEISKLGRLIDHMFKNAESTNPHLNRIIVYTLNICILKATENKRGFILLFNEAMLPAAFILNRSIFELWAAAFFVEKAVENFCKTRNEAELAKIAGRLFAGTIYPAQLPWGEPSNEKPVHISTMIRELEQEYPSTKQTYSFLCEYCHPNFLYNLEASMASFRLGVWDNPKFRKSVSNALEKQLLSLEQALTGIKTSTRAVSEMCLKEYSVH